VNALHLPDCSQAVDNIVKLPKWFEWRRQPRRRSTDRLTVFSSQVGIGTLLQGVLQGKGSYLIQGEVVGDGDIEGAVVLAAGAYWKGDVVADYVRIAGKVEGHVVARAKIELTPTAVVTGDLSAPVVAIAEGAQYEGAISRPRKTQITRHNERRVPVVIAPPT
jgi:cytoskeletal protein CcmA (bactofilin family)